MQEMTTQKDPPDAGLDDAALDALLADAWFPAPPPAPGLMTRILADAAEVSAGQAASGPPRPALPAPRPPRDSWLQRLADRLLPVGGLGGAAALASCAAIGLWLGAFSQEGFVSTVAGEFQVSGGTSGDSFDSAAEAVVAFYDLSPGPAGVPAPEEGQTQ